MKKILEISLLGDVIPKNIICLNKQYDKDLEEFKQYLRSVGKDVIVFSTQRMNQHGVSVTPYKGYVIKVEVNGFSFKYDLLNEDEQPKFMRFDNVLSEIPVFMKNASKNYFKITDQFFDLKKQYQEFWQKHSLLTGGLQLIYTYAPGSIFFEKEYIVKGNLLAVNQSNIEYEHCLTWGAPGTPSQYVDMVPRKEIDRFIAPDRILRSVILYDSPVVINQYDEE